MAGNLVSFKTNLVSFKDNKVLFASAGDPCCCGDLCNLLTATCPDAATAYTVSGDFASLSGCDNCAAPLGGAVPWNGIVDNSGSGCAWLWEQAGACGQTSVGPYGLSHASVQLTATPDGTTCYWVLCLFCCPIVGDLTPTLWVGTKLTGTTPAGTYNLAASDPGCGGTDHPPCSAAPATLTVS